MEAVQIAIIGAGIFVTTEYIPRLAEISNDLFTLKAIWSRTQESAKGAVEIAKAFFPNVECKWGDAGLDHIIQDPSIDAVCVVVGAQFQVNLSLKLLSCGKHVLQEKPAAAAMTEMETALEYYNSFSTGQSQRPIWAIAENFRMDPAFLEGKKLMAEIGDMVNFQIVVEATMNSSNPYFSTSWRHSITGGYILDMGVHFIAALRMLAGCEVSRVSAFTSHVEPTLPPPDSLSSVIQLENGCSGIMVILVSANAPRRSVYRVVGSKGALHIDVENRGGEFGYSIKLFVGNEQKESNFYPFGGVVQELQAFFHDVSRAKKDGSVEAEPRISVVEGARDFAVLDALLESGKRQGALVQVKKI